MTKKKDAENKVDAVKEEASDAKDASSASEEGGGGNVVGFLRGTKEELDKVVWPSRQQLISESIAVILMVTLSATIIYLVDNLFRWIANSPYVFG